MRGMELTWWGYWAGFAEEFAELSSDPSSSDDSRAGLESEHDDDETMGDSEEARDATLRRMLLELLRAAEAANARALALLEARREAAADEIAE